jgi:hypothetical protein
MSMDGFPLLLIPVAIYNIIAFLMPGVHFDDTLVKLTLISGTEWQVDLSDILLALGIRLLLFEVIKGARPGAKYLTDHLLDFLSGIALRARRGTVLASPAAVSRKAARKVETPVVEPAFEPAPSPIPSPMPEPTTPVPAATSVAESVLLDRPEPSVAPPAVVSSAALPEVPSPDVPSPGLQPGHSLPPPSDLPPR